MDIVSPGYKSDRAFHCKNVTHALNPCYLYQNPIGCNGTTYLTRLYYKTVVTPGHPYRFTIQLDDNWSHLVRGHKSTNRWTRLEFLSSSNPVFRLNINRLFTEYFFSDISKVPIKNLSPTPNAPNTIPNGDFEAGSFGPLNVTNSGGIVNLTSPGLGGSKYALKILSTA